MRERGRVGVLEREGGGTLLVGGAGLVLGEPPRARDGVIRVEGLLLPGVEFDAGFAAVRQLRAITRSSGS
jgi:hypothetical protein